MNTQLKLITISLVALVSFSSLTACTQKPTSEEIAAQVKIALEQEKAKEAGATQTVTPAPVAAPVAAPEPVKKAVVPKHAAVKAKPVVHENTTAAQPVAEQKPVCTICGVVLAVNMVEEQGKGSGLGVVGGGVVGGLLGHQVGNGTGRDLATLAGAVGGAFAGNAIEKNAKKTKHYDILIRMNDGTERTYHQPQDLGFAKGDKVRIENDVIIKN